MLPYSYVIYIIVRIIFKITYRYLCGIARYIYRVHCEIMNENNFGFRDQRQLGRIDDCVQRRSEDGDCSRCGRYFVRLSAHHIRCRQKKA